MKTSNIPWEHDFPVDDTLNDKLSTCQDNNLKSFLSLKKPKLKHN